MVVEDGDFEWEGLSRLGLGPRCSSVSSHLPTISHPLNQDILSQGSVDIGGVFMTDDATRQFGGYSLNVAMLGI